MASFVIGLVTGMVFCVAAAIIASISAADYLPKYYHQQDEWDI